jgi:flagellar biosynthetic protein FliR
MSFASLAAFVLLLVRPGMLVMGTPFLGAVNAPVLMRIGLTVLLAIVLAPFVSLPAELSAGAVAVVVLREVAIGLALALAIRVLITAGEFAGHFAGYQIGLSLGSLIDPQTGVRNNVLAIVYAHLVTIVCLATNTHHALLRALTDSYRALPVGFGGLSSGLSASVAESLGLVFILGVRIAAPVVVVLLLVELALGLVARVAPSLNVMIAGAPVRIVLGLLVVALSVEALPGLISRFVPLAFQAAAGTAQAFR